MVQAVLTQFLNDFPELADKTDAVAAAVLIRLTQTAVLVNGVGGSPAV